jgi:DNA-binding XRE family transcriptional regulator
MEMVKVRTRDGYIVEVPRSREYEALTPLKIAVRQSPYTIRDIADELGVHPSTVYAWIGRTQTPRLQHALALSALLGIKIEDVIAPNPDVQAIVVDEPVAATTSPSL